MLEPRYAAYWQAYLDTLPPDAPQRTAFVEAWAFGDSPALADELGLNVLYAGHYATETFGARAIGEALAKKFGLEHVFIDLPTGL